MTDDQQILRSRLRTISADHSSDKELIVSEQQKNMLFEQKLQEWILAERRKGRSIRSIRREIKRTLDIDLK